MRADKDADKITHALLCAQTVIAGWKSGRIEPRDEGEDSPDGDIALAKLDDALRDLYRD